jgi:GNAT superfamily N-acetyltransferase
MKAPGEQGPRTLTSEDREQHAMTGEKGRVSARRCCRIARHVPSQLLAFWASDWVALRRISSRGAGSLRTTRHCWCMAFCATRSQFAVGWVTAGNRRRFEAMAADGEAPMGILALHDDAPVGWCACGPRSRYAVAIGPRSTVMRNRAPNEDDTVWLLPCLFVRPGSRGRGVTHALVGAAVELAHSHGALALEGWPLAATERRSSEAFLGREQVFEDLGFRCVERPSPGRVIMRLEL